MSFDEVEKNKRFAEKFKFPYRLLSDTGRKMGLAYETCDDVSARAAKRHTYVIGPDGRIEHAIETKNPAGQADELLQFI